MPRPYFGYSSAKNTFGTLNANMSASDYLNKKKQCVYDPCSVNTNTSNLNYNLRSKMDLTDVCVLSTQQQICPVTINPTYNRANTYYVVDPQGTLFGKTSCGINDFTSFAIP